MAGRAENAGSAVAWLRYLTVALGGVALLAAPDQAFAGPWTKAQGEGLLIAKIEAMSADLGFNAEGDLERLPAERTDDVASVFAEYGLTDRLTVQFKGEWQSGRDAFVDFEGRGPVEIGVTWQAWRDDWAAASLYAGYANGGEGRNAGYALPGQGEHDWELRGALGRSFAGEGRFENGFAEVQVARRWRDGLPDEVRLDVTAGLHLDQDWMVLTQAYGGRTDDGGAAWLAAEASVVRRFGDWSLQAGWRETVWGRETAQSGGIVLGVWRRF